LGLAPLALLVLVAGQRPSPGRARTCTRLGVLLTRARHRTPWLAPGRRARHTTWCAVRARVVGRRYRDPALRNRVHVLVERTGVGLYPLVLDVPDPGRQGADEAPVVAEGKHPPAAPAQRD